MARLSYATRQVCSLRQEPIVAARDANNFSITVDCSLEGLEVMMFPTNWYVPPSLQSAWKCQKHSL